MGDRPKIHRFDHALDPHPLTGQVLRVTVCGRKYLDNLLLTVSPAATQCKYCRHHQSGLKLPKSLPQVASVVPNVSARLRSYVRQIF